MALLDSRRVVLLAYDELSLFEFSIALDVLRFSPPEVRGEWYELVTASESGKPVRVVGGGQLTVDTDFGALRRAGTVVVPGWQDRPVPPSLSRAIASAHDAGTRIASICTGAIVLASAGLLRGRRATTHWRHIHRLRRADPTVEIDERALYVDHGDVVTSAGAAAGIDMLLHLVRRDFGAEAANAVARGMVVPGHREGDQAQFIRRAATLPEDDRLARVMVHVRGSLGARHSVSRLAKIASMSDRSFFRHFRRAVGMTPQEWLLEERLRAARALLEQRDIPLERIAERTGFGNADLLRYHFRRSVGLSPTAYRRSFTYRVAAD